MKTMKTTKLIVEVEHHESITPLALAGEIRKTLVKYWGEEHGLAVTLAEPLQVRDTMPAEVLP